MHVSQFLDGFNIPGGFIVARESRSFCVSFPPPQKRHVFLLIGHFGGTDLVVKILEVPFFWQFIFCRDCGNITLLEKDW